MLSRPAPPVTDVTSASGDCVGGAFRPRLARAAAEDLALLLRALSDPTRLQILSMIEGSPAGEACVCDLTEPFDMTQPAISHHLRILVQAGALRRQRRGNWVWYSLVPQRLEDVRHLLPGPEFLKPGESGAA